jgi:hypothetical protein
LVVTLRGRRLGRWKHFELGDGGDLIDLIRWAHGCEFVDACIVAAELLNATPEVYGIVPPRKDPRLDDNEDARRRLLEAHKWFSSAAPIFGSLAEIYLKNRGIEQLPTTDDLRFHPKCWVANGYYPVLIALTRDLITGEPRGIYRTAITPDGKRHDRKALGPVGGAAIKLWPDEAVNAAGALVIGEGLETTLAAATRIVHRGCPLRPAWAAGSAENIRSFPVLPIVQTLLILVDNEESGGGRRAAGECARRWIEAGRKVIRLVPRGLGEDFNDVILQGNAAP